MKAIVRNETIQRMIEIIEDLKAEKTVKKALDVLLDHPDYVMEFARYGHNVPREVFIDYLNKFWTLCENDIDNPNLKAHHKYYLDLYHNTEEYKDQLADVTVEPSVIAAQAKIAKAGLPDDLGLDEVHIVFTIGIGGSFGYVHGNQVHFDYLQLVKDYDTKTFQSSLAHEMHHVGFSKLITPDKLSQLSLEALFYCYFSGEGLAVKYCNNAEGVLSKAIYDSTKNIGLDPFSWAYLNADFDNGFQRFLTVIKQLRSGAWGQEELMEELRTYWMNPYTETQDKQETPKLKQFRLYSFGNDIWGIIHDAFGKMTVYETLENPQLFPKRYNEAVTSLGFETYKLPLK